VHPQHADYAAMRQAWIEADELGVDTIFTWDHFFPLYGDLDGKHFEGLTLLAAMGEVTERADISALVFCNAYRNPQYLADALRTIDHISGGRVILGIGGGWNERDFEEFGYEFGTFGSRLDALARDLPVMRRRAAAGNPPPVRPIPVLIGGSGKRKTLRIAAEHASTWHAEGEVDEYGELAEVLAGHCAAVGRDPSEIEHSWSVEAGEVERAEALADAGIGHVLVKINGSDRGYDLGPVRELVQWRERRARAVL
jgi:probable F420-dependent oxidoreductase